MNATPAGKPAHTFREAVKALCQHYLDLDAEAPAGLVSVLLEASCAYASGLCEPEEGAVLTACEAALAVSDLATTLVVERWERDDGKPGGIETLSICLDPDCPGCNPA